MYGFKKMKRRLHGVAFAHPLFLRDDVEETLMLIKRRRNILKKQNKVTSEDQTISDSSDKLQKNISNVVEENCNHETALSYVQNMNVKQFYQPQQIFEPFLSFQNY